MEKILFKKQIKVTEILDNKKQININNNYEINSFSYEKAIKNDKISFC